MVLSYGLYSIVEKPMRYSRPSISALSSSLAFIALAILFSTYDHISDFLSKTGLRAHGKSEVVLAKNNTKYARDNDSFIDLRNKEIAFDSNSKTVVIIGDSHATDIAMSLSLYTHRDFKVKQLSYDDLCINSGHTKY